VTRPATGSTSDALTGSAPTGRSMFDGLWTLPNLVTLVRLLCIPLFLYLLFGVENRAAAALLLGGLGATDWVDGYLARRLGQVSEFGKVFDPTVDRLLFIVGITAILTDGSMPFWFGVAVVVREVLVGSMMVIATFVFGMARIDVTWLGKTATFLLMFAVPSFLLGSSDIPMAWFFEAAGWGLGIPGLALSWYTGFSYVPHVRANIAAGRAARRDAISPTT
jgi:cardiolipin synthase (CMP-forming)